LFLAFPGFFFLSVGNSTAGSLFIVGAMFDAVDGEVARLTKRVTAFGGILDATLDRIFEGLLLLSIGIGGLVPWPWLFGCQLASLCVSYVKAKAEAVTKTAQIGTNTFSVGIAGRAIRLALLFLGTLLNPLAPWFSMHALTWAVILVAILSSYTFVIRFWKIYQVVDRG